MQAGERPSQHGSNRSRTTPTGLTVPAGADAARLAARQDMLRPARCYTGSADIPVPRSRKLHSLADRPRHGDAPGVGSSCCLDLTGPVPRLAAVVPSLPRVLSRTAGAAVLLLCCQCASGPDLPRVLTVVEGERVRVSFTEVSDNRTLSLQNASSGTKETVYKDPKSDLGTKVVEDGRLQLLLDMLAQAGMFQRTAPAASASARELLVVDQGGRKLVWSRGPVKEDGIDAVKAFDQARAYFLAMYNGATAFHSRNWDKFDLVEEQARMEASGKVARERWGQQGSNR